MSPQHPCKARHAAHAMMAVRIGTGASNAIFGQENQRCAMAASVSGVQTLTNRIAKTTQTRQTRPIRRAHSCNAPSVLMISQPAPNSPYPAIRARPVSTENGVNQSHDDPTKARSSTAKPWTKPPRTAPCAKAAIAEPAQKPRDQNQAIRADGSGTRRRRRGTRAPAASAAPESRPRE